MTLTELLAQYDVDEHELAELLADRLRERPAVGSVDLTEAEATFWDRHAGLPLAPAAAAASAAAALLGDELVSVADQAASSLTTEQVASLLRVDRTRVAHRIRHGELYAFRLGRQQRLPRWQFTGSKGRQVLPGLERVLAVLPEGLHPLSVEGFFATPDPDLGDSTPAQWLSSGGDPEVVVREASTLDRW
ncbi:MAG: helix-turn-helix domain-containing protein [Lapillicoccus sp.]